MGESEENIHEDPPDFPEEPVDLIEDEDLTDAQRIELERRLEEHLKDPTDVVSWEEVQERLRAMLRKD